MITEYSPPHKSNVEIYLYDDGCMVEAWNKEEAQEEEAQNTEFAWVEIARAATRAAASAGAAAEAKAIARARDIAAEASKDEEGGDTGITEFDLAIARVEIARAATRASVSAGLAAEAEAIVRALAAEAAAAEAAAAEDDN